MYADVISELKKGKAKSLDVVYFPQITGLGSSSISLRYAIPNLKSAKMYLDERSLKSRLEECTKLVLSHKNIPLVDIFGEIDSKILDRQ